MRKWLMGWLMRRALQDHILRQPFTTATRETRTTWSRILVSHAKREW